jgi:hypothetical protein
MRRVVITGLGIVSSIGNSVTEVEASLRAGKSGIVFAPDYAEHGFRSRIHGQPNIVLEDHIDKRDLRFMGDGAAYNFIAMAQAVADSGLEPSDVSNERTGLIMGSGGPSTKSFFKAHNIVRETGSPKRMGPFMVTKGMSSTNSACLATPTNLHLGFHNDRVLSLLGFGNCFIHSECNTTSRNRNVVFCKILFALILEKIHVLLSCYCSRASSACSSQLAMSFNDEPGPNISPTP